MEQAQTKLRRRTDGKGARYRLQAWLGWLLPFLLAGAALYFLFCVWLMPMTISGDSMSPTLRTGEIVLADRLGKYWRRPARGDMIVFTTPDGTFIKRIVGLPGETVEMLEGRVFIDSRPLDESMYADHFTGDLAPTLVPEGAVFVLGDNREKIYDSRMEAVGCIPYERIAAVMRLRISPIRRFTFFK